MNVIIKGLGEMEPRKEIQRKLVLACEWAKEAATNHDDLNMIPRTHDGRR